MFRVFIPGYIETDGILLHLVVVDVVNRHGIEKLPPDQLSNH